MNSLKEILEDNWKTYSGRSSFAKMTCYSVVHEALTELSRKYEGKVIEMPLTERSIFEAKINDYPCSIILDDYEAYEGQNGKQIVNIHDLRVLINGKSFFIPLFNAASSFGSYPDTVEERADAIYTYIQIRCDAHPSASEDIDSIFCNDFRPYW